MPQEQPRTIGRYEVVDRVGRGGMGVVYRARDPRIGRNVAIKLLSVPDESLRDRFLQEAQSVGSLAHRNIVTIFDYGEHDGQSYIVMEFVEGVTLAEQIHENVPIALWRKLEIMEELASGLDYAHNKGIVHRDIKPANVMTDREGVVKILDFGIARVGNITMTQAGMMLGTPNYMSPEQFESGRVDRRSDIFAVGVVFYELLTYRKAFTGEQVWDVMKAVVSQTPTPVSEIIPGIDLAVEAAVCRAIEKDPNKRYQTLAEMSSDISKVKARIAVKLASPLSLTVLTPPFEEAPRTPRPSTDRSLLTKRRAERVDEYLIEARRAFDAGEYGTAVDACDQALLLDPDDARVNGLLEQARQALDHQQALEWMADARTSLDKGDLDKAAALINQATQIDPASIEARDLRSAIDERLQKRDAEQRKQREELEAAQAAVEEQKREFAAGNWHKAIGALEHFTPRHDIVAAALANMRTELADIDRRAREEEERQQREEAEAQRRWVARQLELAKRAIVAQQFTDAIEILEHVQRNSSNAPGLAELLRQAEQGRAAEEETERRKQEIAEILEHAAAENGRGKFVEARTLIASALALDPAHPEALARLREIKTAIEADERKRAHDRDAERAVSEARRRFDAGDHARAIKMLQTFAPVHTATSSALEELRATLADIERQKEETTRKREAERKQREDAEAVAAEVRGKRERKLAAIVGEVRAKVAAGDLKGAAERLEAARKIDAAHATVAEAVLLLTTAQARKKADDARVKAEAAAKQKEAEAQAVKSTAVQAAPVIAPPPEAAPTKPAVRVPKIPEKVIETKVPEKVAKFADVPAPSLPAPAPAQAPSSAPWSAPVTSTQPVPITQRISDVVQQLMVTVRPQLTPRNLSIGGGALVILLAIMSIPLLRSPKPETVETPPAQTVQTPPVAVEPPAPAPVTPAPAPEPPPPAPPPAPTLDQQLAELRDRARQQFSRGEWEGALATAAAAQELRKDDPDLKSILSSAFAAARPQVTVARDATIALGRPAVGTNAFKQAIRKQESSDQQQRNRQTPGAIRAAWEAIDLFKQAQAEGQRVARTETEGRANTPPPPPPATPGRSNAPAQLPTPPTAPTQQPVPAPVPAPPPPTAPAPPTAEPVRPTPPPPSTSPADARMPIRVALSNYAAAYSNLDARAVKRVYPGINEQALATSFSQTKSMLVHVLDEQFLSLTDTEAVVTCTWDLTFVGRVGAQQHQAPKITLRFQKTNGTWVIVDRR